jgi:hypothetical protein
MTYWIMTGGTSNKFCFMLQEAGSWHVACRWYINPGSCDPHLAEFVRRVAVAELTVHKWGIKMFYKKRCCCFNFLHHVKPYIVSSIEDLAPEAPLTVHLWNPQPENSTANFFIHYEGTAKKRTNDMHTFLFKFNNSCWNNVPATVVELYACFTVEVGQNKNCKHNV